MIYYLFLILAAFLFAMQFIFTKAYRKINGDGVDSTLSLGFFAYAAISLFFFVKGCIAHGEVVFGFSVFTLLMTLAVAVVTLLCVYCGVKVLGVGNTSVYSVFMMTGSILLPCVTGLVFFGEKASAIRIAGIALMLVSVFLTVSGEKKGFAKNPKAVLCYVAVFVLNGLIGVLFTVHQNYPELSAYVNYTDGKAVVDNDVFMCWYGISTAAVTAVAMLALKIAKKAKKRKSAEVDGGLPANEAQCVRSEVALSEVRGNAGAGLSAEAALSAAQEGTESRGLKSGARSGAFKLLVSIAIGAGYGVFNGLGNYFIAVGTASDALGASVTFPVVNGGCILFSTLLGAALYKEKLTVKSIVGLSLVIVATVAFMFV